MRRKVLITAVLAFAAALMAGACTKDTEQNTFTGNTTEEPEYQASLNPIMPSAYRDIRGLELEKGTYISIIGKSEATAFWKEVRNGVMQAAEDLNQELGYSGNDRIKVTYNGPAKSEDIDEQVNILDEELSRYPDVIGIASIDEDACTVQFDLATENGIPIIALDSGNKYQGIQCTVKTDNQEAARTGAYKLADEIGGKGEVMVLVHDSKSETAKERVKSFQDEIAKNYSDINVAEVIYCDQLDDLKKQMAEEQNEGLEEGARKAVKEDFSDADAVQYLIGKHPGLSGIFGTNDSATMLGLRAIRQAEQAWEENQKDNKTQEDGKPQEQSGEEGQEPDGGIGADGEKADGKSGEDEQRTDGDSGEDEQRTDGKSGEDEQKPDGGIGADGEKADGKSGEVSEKEAGDSGEDEQKTGGDSGEDAQNSDKASGQDSQADSENEDGEKADPASAEAVSGGRDGEADRASSESGDEKREYTKIVLMGFDVSKEQLKALEEGEISGLVVQNPFGIGYASVVAAARTVLQSGNEAQVSTGYLWVTQDNMNDESIKKMLYQ